MESSKNQANVVLKKMNVVWFVVLSFITGLIYYPIWFLRRRQAINSLHSQKKLKSVVLIIAIVLFSFNLLMSQSSDIEAQKASGTFGAIAIIITIVQSFKVRRILEDHCNEYLQKNVEFSGTATFFFGAFYLQHKINQLQEMLCLPAQQSNVRPMPASVSAQEKEIIRLAQRKGGKLTTLEIVAETSMNSTEVERLMKELTVNGYVGMQVSDTGAIVYEFYGLGQEQTATREEALPQHVEAGVSQPEPLTPQPRPTSQQRLKTEVNGILFEMKACQQKDDGIRCYCAVTSQHHDSEVILGPARIFDMGGNEYRAGKIQIANKAGKEKVQNTLVSQVRTTTGFGFAGVSQRIESLALFEFICTEVSSQNSFKIQFRQIPVLA